MSEASDAGLLPPAFKPHVLKILRLAAVLAITVFFLWLAVRDVDLQRILQTIRAAKFIVLLPAAIVFTASFAVRTWRWHIILTDQGAVRPSVVFWANMAGYLGNHFLPARAGEMVRTALLCRHTNFSKSFVLATALTERMLDAAILVLLSSVAFALSPARPVALAVDAWVIAAVSAICALSLFLIPLCEQVLSGLIGSFPLPARVRVRLTHMLSRAMVGLRAFHAPSKMSSFLALAVAIWCLDAAMAVLVGVALAVPVSFAMALLLLAALGLSSIVPSTPGAIGVYQFVCISVLTPFAIDRNAALAYALVLQALAYCVVTVWGTIGLWRMSYSPAGQAGPA